MPLRLLARAAPLLLGAIAAALWLRRRQAAQRAALPAPPPAPPALPAPPPQRTGRFERAPGRFERTAAREPIDIVTVVDDLLGPRP